MTVIIFIIILAVLIASHEFGHFIVAKTAGIKVEEFGLGLPPRAIGRKWGETLYSLNWIPFGGFVRIFGEDPASLEELHDGGNEGSFSSKSKLVQAAVILAGIFFNILLAFILLWAGFIIGLPASISAFPDETLEDIALTITNVMPGSPAEAAQVPIGAHIINFDKPEDMIIFVDAHKGQEVLVSTDRGDFKIVPAPKLGIEMDLVGTLHLSFFDALWQASVSTYELFYQTSFGIIKFLGSVIVGQGSLSGVAGPVGIAGAVGEASRQGFGAVLYITALISLSLAAINLVPFPALDGGRLLFVIIESIKGSPIRPRIVNAFNLAGFSLLILLMLFVTYHDIAKLMLS